MPWARVTDNARLTGTGVLIYNAGSNYPAPGGSFGGVTLTSGMPFATSACTRVSNWFSSWKKRVTVRAGRTARKRSTQRLRTSRRCWRR